MTKAVAIGLSFCLKCKEGGELSAPLDETSVSFNLEAGRVCSKDDWSFLRTNELILKFLWFLWSSDGFLFAIMSFCVSKLERM